MNLIDRLHREPVLLGYALVAFAAVIAARLLGLTDGDLIAAVGTVGALMALVTRSQVRPEP